MKFTMTNLGKLATPSIKVLKIIVNSFLYLIAIATPKKKGSIVVGSGQGFTFSDNSMFFFLVCQMNASLRNDICWITKSRQVHDMLLAKSLPCKYLYSLRGIFTVLRAQYSVLSYRLSDIQEGLIGGSKIIQLWHGIPIRKIGFNGEWNIHSLLGRVKRVLYSTLPYTYYMSCDVLFSSNEYTTRVFAEAFKYSFRGNTQIIEVPQPRYDYLLETTDFQQILGEEESFIEHHKNGFDKAIVWMPTHRTAHKKQYVDLLSEHHVNLKELSKWLVSKNYILFLKLHPLEKDSFLKLEAYENFIIYNFIESAPLVKLCDTLITDYSSVAFDFISVGKPTIFFAPDIGEYEHDVGFYFNYREVFKDFLCYTNEEVLKLLKKNSVVTNDQFRTQRIEVPNTYSGQILGTINDI